MVCISESIVPMEDLRSKSSGKLPQFHEDTSSWHRFIEKASSYLQHASVAVGNVIDYTEKIKMKSFSGVLQSCLAWVKLDGDRVSRRLTINPDDSFAELLRKIIFRVEVSGSVDEYCLVDIKSRLAESMADISDNLGSDKILILMRKKDAFVPRN